MPFSPFRNYIIKRNSQRFNIYKTTSYRELEEKNPSLFADFKVAESNIHQLVSKTKYWHGTGLYQYETAGSSKYEGVIHTNIYPVLETIISQNALIPRYDPWFEKYLHTPHSISVANQWCYGKMYAHYHLDESTKLEYEISPITFWYHVLIWIQLTEHYCKFMFGFLIVYTFSNVLQKQGKTWMSTFRSDVNKKWPFWKILTAQSDIKGNYSVLFGIKDEIKTIEMIPIARFLETRTDEAIPFSKCLFIAVPHKNVLATKELLEKYNATLTVIPLEYLELYMRRYSLQQIVNHPVPETTVA
jgi:hypothetical protein